MQRSLDEILNMSLSEHEFQEGFSIRQQWNFTLFFSNSFFFFHFFFSNIFLVSIQDDGTPQDSYLLFLLSQAD